MENYMFINVLMVINGEKMSVQFAGHFICYDFFV